MSDAANGQHVTTPKEIRPCARCGGRKKDPEHEGPCGACMLDVGVYFDHDGSNLTFSQFLEREKANPGWRTVAFTDLAPDANRGRGARARRFVSTVLLIGDHGFGGAPLIFETMVFPECDVVARYASRKEAEAGHALAVAEAKDRMKYTHTGESEHDGEEG